LVGLAFSWIGDVALLARESVRLFQLGLSSFLAGHIFYCIAFLARGVSLPAALWAGALASLAAGVALFWLRPHLKTTMRIPVQCYVIVITLMVVLATATVAEAGNIWILTGALLFYVSDLAVARERFVQRSRWNGAWGTPTYFLGQIVLALTVG
jgi:uncharacterized membrane protein YhhN